MSLRVPYKLYPISKPSRAFGEEIHWWPGLPVRLALPRNQETSRTFYAVVDSGSSTCIFHADFLRAFKVNLRDGIEETLGGARTQSAITVYYHDIQVRFGVDWSIGVRAGFSEDLSVAGILGRLGFFDAFRVTFDHSGYPPFLEIDKIERTSVQ
jgi:hypothetical protein